ncbi:MAG: hypothetical protein AAB409_09535 [Gemmatimonadota bacterium]
MRGTLGLGVGGAAVHAVLVRGGKVRWAGSAAYAGPGDLTEVVARLAAECAPSARRVRVVLERDLVQARTLLPPPPVSAAATAGYVALERPRLFRGGNGPLVTDGALVGADGAGRALWAAAASERLTRAIVEGCAQAGLRLDALGPAADVLPHALRAVPRSGTVAFPNGATTEVLDVHRARTWRSRLLRGVSGTTPEWARALDPLGDAAPRFAAAYAAAMARPRLLLLPPEARAARDARAHRSVRRLAVAAAALWALAAGTYAARLGAGTAAVERELARLAPATDSALALRRDLGSALAAQEVIGRARLARSRQLQLLADLTATLGDSTVLVGLRVSPDGALRLSGYTSGAARVLARLERVRSVRGATLEGPPTREMLAEPGRPGREWDRFSILARLERAP